MTWIHSLAEIIMDTPNLFWIASVLGLLAFYMTWITLFAMLSGAVFLSQRQPGRVIVYGIIVCSMLVGIAAGLASHWALDILSNTLTTPLGPPLEIEIGGLSGCLYAF